MDRDDLKKIYEYQVHMTAFADTKAGGFILLFTGVLSGLIGSDRLTYVTAILSGSISPANIIALLALLSLLASLGLLIWAILPRNAPGREHGSSVIFWRDIAREANSSSYLARLRALDGEAWAGQWAEQIYSLASVVSIKFARLRDAVWIGLFGSLLMAWLFAAT